ncbi:MAG: glycerol-3-phosphate 1-O-acyltransferase [Acidimicrobiia bacterium]|nr:glycerol-3-phosphate 1-O-acyltransferase [Acidimicrobiia bacterium]
MDTPYNGLALVDEPAWPVAEGPIIFLLEESGDLERKVLLGWIARHQPASIHPGNVQVAILPQTRRRRRRRRLDDRLDAFLSADGDPLLVPLRVAWVPSSSRDGKRTVGLRDMLELGDPRDPDPVRQHVLYRLHPERLRIVMAESARVSEVRELWERDPRGQESGTGFTDFTTLRAWLALERSERILRGSRYKVPKFPIESLMERPSFTRGLAAIAQETGANYSHLASKTRRYVREIAANHSPYVIDLVTGGFHWLITKAYVSINYDDAELNALYTMSQQHPLVFLPSHKSNFDHLLLQYVLYENGLPPNHTAGGINMNFFPIGPLLRRSGVFFIRREFKDNEPYKFVLREYIDYLLEKRFPLEWYLEGGRSRSGKLRPPRLGMLAYVFNSAQRGSVDDVIFIPVSIAYDQIQDVGSYASEAAGGKKQSESFGWFLRAVRSLRRRYGSAHIRFGAPLSLRTFMAGQDDLPTDADDSRSPAVPKLAFEISNRINEVTPITPISLVTLALLSAKGRSLTLDEVIEVLRPYVDYVRQRDLPMTEKLDLDDPSRVRVALDNLTEHGVVTRFDGESASVFGIGQEQHLAAAYYRNTIIHHFVTSSVAELALLALRTSGAPLTEREILAEAFALRDLLKFEFFFAPSEEFEDQIRAELSFHDPEWRSKIKADDVDGLLRAFQPFQSHIVLRPFFEAYRVIGDLIEQDAYSSVIDKDDLGKRAMALGKQYALQGRIHTPEAVSQVLFDAAIKLAENRKLFKQSPDVVELRTTFAQQLRQVVASLQAIDAITTVADAGLLE